MGYGTRFFLYYHIFEQQKALMSLCICKPTRIVSEYDQEIPQSQTADNPVLFSSHTRHSIDVDEGSGQHLDPYLCLMLQHRLLIIYICA